MKLRTCLLGLALCGSPVAAHASEYGCKVLLCLANPNGPKAVAECVPPIDQLYEDLKKGRSFPTCDMSGNSFARQGYSYYDPCPTGTTALSAGSYAVQGGSAPTKKSAWYSSYGGTIYEGIGEGDGLNPYGSGDDAWTGTRTKTCVGNKVGDAYVPRGSGEDYYPVLVGVYDQLTLLDPQGSPRIIDVFIDNQLYRRVRW